jgi:hypothetical protein
MRKQIFSKHLSVAAGLTVLAFSSMPVAPQTPSNSAAPFSPDQTTTPGQTQTVQLGRGVLLDVLKLSRAHVSDGTIIAFIQGSGTIYGLGADEIVYLQQQGVSDSVVAALVSQRQKVTDAAAQVAQSSNDPVAGTAQPAPNYDQAQTAYAQAPAENVPPATDYIVPNSPPVYLDYGNYPYYGGYYGYYYYPPVPLSVGVVRYYGDGYHGGVYRSGWRGGGGVYHSGGRGGGGGFQGGGSHASRGR